MTEILLVFFLLGMFQIKHFVADYPLQIPYMLGKMKNNGWFFPLLSHVSVHGLITGMIGLMMVGAFGMAAWLVPVLMIFDMVIHFIVDRIKASPKMFGKYTVYQRQFWNALGADQAIHHLTHYVIIFVMVYSVMFMGGL